MASIISEFPEYQVSISISRDTITNVAGVRTTATASVGTVNGLFWEGATAEAYVSAKFRDVTDAVIAVIPSVNIQKDDKISVESKDYRVIGVDNVGAAGEVKTVALEIFA